MPMVLSTLRTLLVPLSTAGESIDANRGRAEHISIVMLNRYLSLSGPGRASTSERTSGTNSSATTRPLSALATLPWTSSTTTALTSTTRWVRIPLIKPEDDDDTVLDIDVELTPSPASPTSIIPLTGSQWNDPGQYEAGKFENCQADDGLIPGVYNGKQWHQGEKPEPGPHPAPRKYKCHNFKGLNGGKARLIPDSRRRSMAFSEDLEADELSLERDLEAARRDYDDSDECYDPEDCPE